ncbi:lytic transglycosylase domain-containing protein [Pantoea sp. PNT02]|uniref:lytic transglycosylase domain-containing protein n=1 Tax=Pantoea sp. PNT02 TaxID=2769261 RepID=UPI00177C1E1C|nr:lytic transglycosylase domain-containing protein [Pantoea sp. PNT02]MBD9646374.1 lytic transglycosylase domain-containing protein [Pantoea sp. PNT02]
MRLFWYASALLVSGIISTSVKADCFIKAGEWYSIDPDYLRAIAWQESRYNPAAINTNISKDGKPGSSDYGIMQINTVTMRSLQKEYPGLSKEKLLSDPCLNIYIGAMLLRRNFNQYGTTWLAVGMYNAGMKNIPVTIKNRYNYAMIIDGHYKGIKAGKIPRVPVG